MVVYGGTLGQSYSGLRPTKGELHVSRSRTSGYLSDSYLRVTDIPGSSVQEFSLIKANGVRGEITDVVVPQFNKLRREGKVYVNPLHLKKYVRQASQDTYTFGPYPAWGVRVLEGTMAAHWSITPSPPSWFATRVANAKAATLTKAHAKVAEETFQGLVTVAEARKTAKMIASPFAKSNELITLLTRRYTWWANRLLKGRAVDLRDLRLIRSSKELAMAAENAWLETRFGWKPVLRELGQIVDAYVDRYRNDWMTPVRRVARASETVYWAEGGGPDGPTPVSYTASTPSLNHPIKMSRECDLKTKIASGVLYQLLDESPDGEVRRRMGLRLSDIPSAAYELVPLSFVADRFALIGDWLKAITPKPGVQVLGAWTTTVETEYGKHVVNDASITVQILPGPATTFHQGGSRFENSTTTVIRDANPFLPILPPVNYRDLELVQHIDHAALIAQRLRGFVPPRRS